MQAVLLGGHLAHMLRFVLFLVDYLLLSSTFCDLDLFFEIDFFGLSVTPKLMTLVTSYTKISDSGHKNVYLSLSGN